MTITKMQTHYVTICLVLIGLCLADEAQNRIIGGVQLTQNLPYFARIYYATATGTEYYYQCGGSFYSNRVVLTAARCFSDPNGKYKIRYGSHLRADTTYEMNALEIRIYPGYVNTTKRHDLAAIVLNGRVALGPLAQKIAIPRTAQQPNEQVKLYGFGFTNPTDDLSTGLSPVLKSLQGQIMDQTACQNYLQANFDPIVTNPPANSYFCLKSTGSGSCLGDEGGPAFRADTQFQFGLLSFNENDDCTPNANGDYVEFYTSFLYPDHLKWIKSLDHYV